jgi:hypothetical protein
MNDAERLTQALRGPDPSRELRSVVQTLAQEGRTRGEIYALLEQVLLDLRSCEPPREAEEEIVLDVMDALTGWCHPSARLLPEGEIP